jgi:hypothetical protein
MSIEKGWIHRCLYKQVHFFVLVWQATYLGRRNDIQCPSLNNNKNSILHNASFEAFTGVMFQVEIFLLVMACSVVVGYHRFRGSPWRWRQHGPPNLWYLTTTLHGVTTLKTSTCNITHLQLQIVLEESKHFQTLYLTNLLTCSAHLSMGTISGTTHIKMIFKFLPGIGKHFITNEIWNSDNSVTQLIHILYFVVVKRKIPSPSRDSNPRSSSP